jgi:hypothetical protein
LKEDFCFFCAAAIGVRPFFSSPDTASDRCGRRTGVLGLRADFFSNLGITLHPFSQRCSTHSEMRAVEAQAGTGVGNAAVAALTPGWKF